MHPLIAYHFLRAAWAQTHLRGDVLTRYHDRRAAAIARFAAGRSPFYRDLYAGRDLNDWRTLPIIDKAAMMSNFDTFNTRGITQDEAFAVALAAERNRDFAPVGRGNITVGLSSGTSGYRGAFLVSPAETAAWAGTVLQRVLHGVPRAGYRVAFFLRSNSNLYERVNGRVRFRWLDLMLPLGDQVAALNAEPPDLLVAPPSLLRAFADAADRGVLRAQPTRIISVAETLEAHDRTFIEAAFGAAVGQVYQCTEGFLAATCAAGRLHVNEDLVALQYEPAGDGGRVSPVVTDLWRRTQPILRYRLGDVLTLDPDSCPCGCAFQVIRAVEGRSDDVCIFPSRDTGEPRRFYPDTIRRMILLADDRITDYAAVQERDGHLRIHVTTADRVSFDAVRTAIDRSATDILASYDCRADQIEFVFGLPPVPSGAKRRRVTRCEAPHNAA